MLRFHGYTAVLLDEAHMVYADASYAWLLDVAREAAESAGLIVVLASGTPGLQLTQLVSEESRVEFKTRPVTIQRRWLASRQQVSRTHHSSFLSPFHPPNHLEADKFRTLQSKILYIDIFLCSSEGFLSRLNHFCIVFQNLGNCNRGWLWKILWWIQQINSW